MTQNQINYQKLLEDQRSNLANEELTRNRDAETARSNVARETETHRSNLARELETNRSNLANEAETNRSNLARELETNRHNLATESETARSNRANEAIGNRNAATAERNAAETKRSNLARELETNRHNLNQEGLTAAQIESDSRVKQQVAQISADATRYTADQRSDAQRYSADQSLKGSYNQALTSRINTIRTNANNLAIEELRQQGFNERQIRQITADAVNVLHDDIVELIKSGSATKVIRDLIMDWSLRQLRKGN